MFHFRFRPDPDDRLRFIKIIASFSKHIHTHLLLTCLGVSITRSEPLSRVYEYAYLYISLIFTLHFILLKLE